MGGQQWFIVADGDRKSQRVGPMGHHHGGIVHYRERRGVRPWADYQICWAREVNDLDVGSWVDEAGPETDEWGRVGGRSK